MMAEAPPQAEPRWKRAGPPYQFTRDELLAEFADMGPKPGVKLSERLLRSWTARGLLPTPVRRVPPLAQDGLARALYPGWTYQLLRELLQARARGAALADLKGIADAVAADAARKASADVTTDAAVSVTPIPAVATWTAITPGVSATYTPPAPVALRRAAWEYARKLLPAETSDEAHLIVNLTVTVRGDVPVTIPIPRPPTREPEAD